MADSNHSGRNLVLILGDQLTPAISSLREADPGNTHILMAEVRNEATYVWHHKKKLALVFSAMRHFAAELEADGWTVNYVRLNDRGNTQSISGELTRWAEKLKARRIVATEPGEWRLRADLDDLRETLDVPLDIVEDDRFIVDHESFEDWAEGRKQLRMEHFYREVRRKTGLLMDGDEPAEGHWNFDQENRKPPKKDMTFPAPARFEPDSITRTVIDLVEQKFADNPGKLEPFGFPVTRNQAEEALDHFIEACLPRFGDFQDAMVDGEAYLFHSVLSPAINLGLLDPLTVCERAEKAYRDGHAPINAAEGFIRQIIGWREYVRGIYWLFMPDYVDRTELGATRGLPDFYWSGETRMNCLAATIGQTLDEAYAHHIQRLMITGNFAMLTGCAPRQVHEWYLAIYADAYEWVELPNTLGMSQFADGGLLGSKPYAAGGNYINKMSTYCKSCAYDIKKKTGENACPFNYLYWDFLARNRDALEGNHRLGRVYSTWDRMKNDRRETIRSDAAAFLDALDRGDV